MVVKNIDIAVIGGGIQGLFLAYYAKKKYPTKKIFLFESKIVGAGITAYSGHLHLPYGTGEKNKLTELSLSLYNELCDKFHDFPIERREFIGVCKKENLDSITQDITNNNFLIDASKYTLKENLKNYTTISNLRAFATKRNIANYLMEMIIEMGVIIYEGTEITNIQKNNVEFELKAVSGLKFTSSVILNATGASLYNLIKNDNLTLRTKKVVAFHINHSPLKEEPITYFFDDDAFLLPQPYYSRYLFSYKCNEWDLELDQNSFKIKASDIENAQKVLNKYTTDFSTKILGGQVYIDVYNTPTSSPLIHELQENYFAVGATGGSGVRLAPALAIETLKKIKI